MDLVYIWIDYFKNIQQQGFNFGSEYVYSTTVDGDKIIVDRQENKRFIPGFFKVLDGDGFENITAIVGENASGKSNFLDALRRIITQGGNLVFNYLLVYAYKEGGETKTVVIDNTERECQVNFTVDPDKGGLFKELIYYSPVVDFSIYPVISDTPIGIDVSSDWLIYEDYKKQSDAIDDLNAMEHFKFQDCMRQLKFAMEVEGKQTLSSKVTLPKRIRFEAKRMDFVSSIENMSDARNVPYAYRDYYNLLAQEKLSAVDDYASIEYDAQKKYGDKSKELEEVNKKKCFAFFIINLVTNIFYHLDSTNHYLSKGSVKISIDELRKYSLEDGFVIFIKNQDLISAEPVLELLELVWKLIEQGSVKYSEYDSCSWNSDMKLLPHFLKCYDAYLKCLEKFVTFYKPKGFIDVDWSGMSSGEKAYLNIFSRIFYAKQRIISKVEDSPEKTNRIPNTIYLLVDEGELGFHLQWQKEYINELNNVIPSILRFIDNDQNAVNPKIHLVFTTHSPVSLSDIPNHNIVYVKKLDTGLMKVLNASERPKQSFGANIHNLMSNSFYLTDGLVGKFAVSKINHVISLIKKQEINILEKEYIRNVIELIDEPTLKIKLTLMFEQKHLKLSELEILEKQRIALDLKIELLRSKSGN